jgi:HSP20 family protein
MSEVKEAPARAEEQRTKLEERKERGGREVEVQARGGHEVARRPAESPFQAMRRMAEDMDRIFERLGFGLTWPRFRFPEFLPAEFEEAWLPEVEVFERDNRFVVRTDLPGVKKDDVKVEVSDDMLVLCGERKHEEEERRRGFYRSERSYGSFYRSIGLPEGVNPEDAKASFENGVLEVEMGLTEGKPKAREIRIR